MERVGNSIKQKLLKGLTNEIAKVKACKNTVKHLIMTEWNISVFLWIGFFLSVFYTLKHYWGRL